MPRTYSFTWQIFVQTERHWYRGGDVVNGAIYLNIVKSFDCTGLELNVRVLSRPLLLYYL